MAYFSMRVIFMKGKEIHEEVMYDGIKAKNKSKAMGQVAELAQQYLNNVDGLTGWRVADCKTLGKAGAKEVNITKLTHPKKLPKFSKFVCEFRSVLTCPKELINKADIGTNRSYSNNYWDHNSEWGQYL